MSSDMSPMHEGMIPEWAPQDAVLVAWPTEYMDWVYILEEVECCYKTVVETLAQYVPVLILVDTQERVIHKVSAQTQYPIICIEGYHLNDTWARDYAPICVSAKGRRVVLNFGFNGWGLKFAADRDNLVGRQLYTASQLYGEGVEIDHLHYFVYEGGGVESNGAGLVLTTSGVYDSDNRMAGMETDVRQRILREHLGCRDLLVLDVPPMIGDDTDGHIDTLARFVNEHTIVYNHTEDTTHPDYAALQCLEQELTQGLRSIGYDQMDLVQLPIPSVPIYATNADGETEQLPATYANFLITNGAVMVPTYNDPNDSVALEILQEQFSDRKVVGVDCSALVRQHGSLHCITMQLAQGFINKSFGV